MPDLFTTKTLDLSTASPTQGIEFNIPGHTFQVVAASSSAAVIKVRVDERDDASEFQLRQGMGWEQRPYRKLYISWAAQAGVSVTLAFAGDPNAARPELVKTLPASATSSVTIDNPLGSPVPVSVTGQPVTVKPSGVVPVTASFNTPPAEEDWFVAAGFNQAMSQTSAFVLTTSAAAVGIGLSDYVHAVPAGKKLRVLDACVDATGFCAGYLYAEIGGVVQAAGVASRNGGKVYSLIGFEFSAGTRFRFRSEYAGSQTVSAGVSGVLLPE